MTNITLMELIINIHLKVQAVQAVQIAYSKEVSPQNKILNVFQFNNHKD